jgi:dolichol-phosphate mannosyltransferase
MQDEATAVEIRRAPVAGRGGMRPHTRVLDGMRRPANWLQLVRFALVGGTGFVVNLLVYALCVRVLGIHYQVASVIAWLVAVCNNFVLNRHWTFDARHDRAHRQAVRFLLVSLAAEGVSLLLLTALVEGAGFAKVAAQAFAVAASMPLNFLGNKLWSFRAEGPRERAARS